MLGVRVNTFNEAGLGEPEQDANSALTELDKGLRSSKQGEQCEAIVRFPRLFEKYPFPILINASFLKLAEVFRCGTNFLRMAILKVCQQSEKHLDKISNVDEFVRRVYSVTHSNDPIARGLALRTLGAVAGIIPERGQVHHSIRRSLESHDNVEVQAAIVAATQFASVSKSFAISMCNKISDMIQGQATPLNMKLKLIPILQHMHHDTATASMVRKVCIDLLPSYPSKEFVLVILNTMTQLASATLVDIPAQVLFLLEYVRNDPRFEIRAKALEDLHTLAKPGAHLWPPGSVNDLIDMALATDCQKFLMLALIVVYAIVESPKMCHDNRHPDSKLRELCEKNSKSHVSPIAAQSIQVLTKILCYCYEENLEAHGSDSVIQSLENLFLILTYADKRYPGQMRVALKCAVRLCQARTEHCGRFMKILGSGLQCEDEECLKIILEAMGAVGSLRPEQMIFQLRTYMNMLDKIASSRKLTQHQIDKSVLLCTLIFQTMVGHAWCDETNEILRKVTSCNNLWANYRIARAAVRYGHHHKAVELFDNLTEQVSSENLHFWLVCLREMCAGESELINERDEKKKLVDRLECAILHYNKAMASLKAATTPLNNLQFQAEYLRIRSEFLQNLQQLIFTCNILCVVPPPAIASTIVQSTRDEYQRHGYITNQMRKVAKDFNNCSEMYWKLYQTAFDADPATLDNIQTLQQMCLMLEQTIETICLSNTQTRENNFQFDPEKARLECRTIVKSCDNAVKLCQKILAEIPQQTITHKHVELLKAVDEIVANASICYPRFFFQVLQSTNIKLAVSPQPRVLGEFISVQSGSQLAVKVEGVIQHGQKPGLFRKVEQLVITVTSQLQTSNKNIKEHDQKNSDITTVLSQTVTPHKDFFTAQFLLAFPRGGQYLLVIEASIIDEHNNTWKSGPRSTLSVKVPEEAKLAPINMPGMVSNTNVILMTEDNLMIRQNKKN